MEEDDNQIKITCKLCNGFVTFKVRSAEILYITFIHAGLSTLGLYTEEIHPEVF